MTFDPPEVDAGQLSEVHQCSVALPNGPGANPTTGECFEDRLRVSVDGDSGGNEVVLDGPLCRRASPSDPKSFGLVNGWTLSKV